MNSTLSRTANKGEAAPSATEMSAQEWREHRYQCPLEAALDIIGGRWKGAVLFHLSGKPQRFNELRRTFPGLSQRSLTTQLRELERDGVVARTVYAQVPARVEYALTERGQELVPLLRGLSDWGTKVVGAASCFGSIET